MSIIFKCKTGEAFQVKVLAELLTNNLKTGCFIVNEEEIVLRLYDQHRKTLVDMNLQAENFSMFKFHSDENMCLGLNLSHFHKMLKSIKKKDSLELSICRDNPNILAIKTIPKENTRVTTSFIKIQNIQNVVTSIPAGYGKPVIVPSSDFQKMCKELSSIGSDKIQISAKQFYIDFIANTDDIMKRSVRLGDSDEDSAENSEVIYNATFTTEQFVRISKIAGLSTTLQIFPGTKELPVLFRSSVGSLGKISIYIKSKELLDREQEQTESNDSDSDSN